MVLGLEVTTSKFLILNTHLKKLGNFEVATVVMTLTRITHSGRDSKLI